MDTVIAVVGPGDAPPQVASLAEGVGAAVARAGATLVCGGLGGVMEAACRGARGAGGRTVGILPGDDRRAANRYIDVAVATGLGEGRNLAVVRTADAVVAIGGGWGTLSEIALARRLGRPVVGLGTWGVQAPGGAAVSPPAAEEPEEAVRLALSLAAGA